MPDLSERPSAKGRNQMELYVIYEHPSDFPDKYVLRRWKMERTPKKPLLVADKMEDCRAMVPRGMVNVGRMNGDAPSIVSVFI